MSLFASGLFTLASGKTSTWKIDCDALTEDDWATLALMAAEVLPPFGSVFGVPRGGTPFAEALQEHASNSSTILLADDVWTTGGSWRKCRSQLDADTDVVSGIVVFARNPIYEPCVQAIFTGNGRLDPNPHSVRVHVRQPDGADVIFSVPRAPLVPPGKY